MVSTLHINRLASSVRVLTVWASIWILRLVKLKINIFLETHRYMKKRRAQSRIISSTEVFRVYMSIFVSSKTIDTLTDLNSWTETNIPSENCIYMLDIIVNIDEVSLGTISLNYVQINTFVQRLSIKSETKHQLWLIMINIHIFEIHEISIFNYIIAFYRFIKNI
jgi:hypothetical protein